MKLLLAFFLLSTSAAFAACPGNEGEPLPPRAELAALESRLARLAAECSANAGYLAYHGAVLNALGRPAEAALLLEQALLLDPGRAGAQIDYAEALAALGERASAAALLRAVLARPDVPAALRPRLEQRLDAIEAERRPGALAALWDVRAWIRDGWHAAGSLTLKIGRDSNLNSAPSHDALTLTLPGGDAVLLALAERFRPQAGTAGLAEGRGQLIRPLAGGAAMQLYGEARLRESPGAAETSYQQVQAGAAWSQPLDGGSVLISAGASHLHYGGADLYRAFRLAASRDWRLDAWRPSAGFEVEWRRYPAVPELEGRFLGLSAGLSGNRGADRWVAGARLGRDAAQADRPGGDQRQGDLRLVWTRPLAAGRFGADLLVSWQRDEAGYSPLLENGAARRISRARLHLEYAHPVAPGWEVLASLDAAAQRSNLALFDVSGRAIYLGVRWRTE